jgi:hypothetical protein
MGLTAAPTSASTSSTATNTSNVQPRKAPVAYTISTTPFATSGYPSRAGHTSTTGWQEQGTGGTRPGCHIKRSIPGLDQVYLMLHHHSRPSSQRLGQLAISSHRIPISGIK